MERKISLTAFEASELFYNLFFDKKKAISLRDYLDNSFCDEIGEVDLESDAYSIFYHVENKYMVPVIDGSYHSLHRFAMENDIHPDDRALYDSMMNPGNVRASLANSEHKNFFFFHYRLLLQDGTYRYVEEAVIAGREYGVKPNHFRFYVYDIQNVKSREAGEQAQDGYILEHERNDITGLYEERAFYAKAEKIVETRKKEDWCLVAIDIRHFTMLDEWFGSEKADFLLASLGKAIRSEANAYSSVGGYLGHDDFLLLMPFDEKAIQAFYEKLREAIAKSGTSAGFTPALGIAKLCDAKNLRDAYDKASIACSKSKTDYREHVLVFDMETQRELEQEYHLLIHAITALRDGEFTFYLQPQCLISTRQIVGAEALARWIRKDGTIISPKDFVPVLEKYGFITDLDQFIWEEVAKFIRKAIDEGRDIVPISVNVSRIDIYAFDVADHFASLIKKYRIPAKNIKIEITESAYVDKEATVGNLIERLHSLGFLVLMDDFGSGYSSLNMLSSLQIDAIKLDSTFLKLKEESFKKGIHILESIVNMAKILSIPIIVEGAEMQDQIDFLERQGVQYVQGYYFYKGMPKAKFEKLIEDKTLLSHSGFEAKTNEQFRLREFLDENIYSDSMLNNILGAVALYLWDGKRVDITRFNEQFYKAVDVPDFQERLIHIERFVLPEDSDKLYALLQNAYDNKLNGSIGTLHFYKTDGTLTTFIMHFYYLRDTEGGKLFYGSARNTTRTAGYLDRLNLISEYSSDTIFFLKQFNGQWVFEVASLGPVREYFPSRESFEEALNNHSIFKSFFNYSLEELFAIADEAYANKKVFTLRLQMKMGEGTTKGVWVQADLVNEEANNIKYILTAEFE